MQFAIASSTEETSFNSTAPSGSQARNLIQELLLRHRWLSKVELFFTNDVDFLRITCGKSETGPIKSFPVSINRLVFHDARASYWTDGQTALTDAAIAHAESALAEIIRSLANLHCCFSCTERQLRHAVQEDVAQTMVATAVISAADSKILDLLCQGKTNLEISDILGITPSRVRHSTTRIYDRLGVKNRYEATAVWSKRGPAADD
jgi:DNA-binding CsgD family transcriptional regulator